MGREMGGRFKREGMYLYLWMVHVEVWQKRTKFCKAITLQLKNKLIKKNDLAWTPSFSAGPGSEDRKDSGGNSVGNRLTPSGSRQVSLIQLLLGVRAWARCPASRSLSVHVCWMGITAAWTSPGCLRDYMTDSESIWHGAWRTESPAHCYPPSLNWLPPNLTSMALSQSFVLKKTLSGDSMVVQTLGLGIFTVGTPVWSLVGELRSHKLCSMAKKISKENFKSNK